MKDLVCQICIRNRSCALKFGIKKLQPSWNRHLNVVHLYFYEKLHIKISVRAYIKVNEGLGEKIFRLGRLMKN